MERYGIKVEILPNYYLTNANTFNKDEALDIGKELALEYNIPLYFENELVEIWKNANETLPPVNMLVKVKCIFIIIV